MQLNLNNPVLFAVIWGGLAALILQDVSVRHAHHGVYGKGVATTDRVIAKEFVLVDDNGNTRARIGMNDKDAPTLQLLDRSGQTRAQLRLNQNDVPSLRLYDEQGRVRNVMGFTLNDMNPSFVTFDNNGTGHLNNTARPDAGYVNVQDEDHTWKNISGLNASAINLNVQDPIIYTYSNSITLPPAQQLDTLRVDVQRQAEMARDQARAAEVMARDQARAAQVQAEEMRQEMKRAQQEIKQRLNAEQSGFRGGNVYP